MSARGVVHAPAVPLGLAKHRFDCLMQMPWSPHAPTTFIVTILVSARWLVRSTPRWAGKLRVPRPAGVQVAVTPQAASKTWQPSAGVDP
jgi:hypothetical protein